MPLPGYHQLSLLVRRTIFRLVEARVPVGEIAARLGRHRSTIYREVSRNHFHDLDDRERWRDTSGYYPVTAQSMAFGRRRRLAKLARCERLRSQVVDQLRAGWSPQQIAGRLGLDASVGSGERLCHETIYRYVYSAQGRAEDLYLCLARARRRRGRRHGRRPHADRVAMDRGIASRPAEVCGREVAGHWEGDLLVFSREHGSANTATLLERSSRYVVLVANPDRRPTQVARRIAEALCHLPAALRRTITFDRGVEFLK